ncbi:MAG TPA: glycosyltransferase [Gemmataceae bacterium]|nr:glycosyltransferase [Gemmataceae bacterium]
MHAVIVDGDVSYPPTSGKRLRTLHLMLRLARRHRVTYIARCDARLPDAQQAREHLGDHGIETILVDHPLPRKAGLAFGGRLASNLLLSNLPYSIASHDSEPMRQALAHYRAKNEVDVWQFEWLPYMNLLPSHSLGGEGLGVRGHACRVVIAHNVDTLLWKRYYDTAQGMFKRMFLKSQWRRMERFERLHFPRASWVVAVSPDDASILRNDFGVSNVDVVDNGIDRDYFASVNGNREANRILFLGALDWRPNLDAVNLLLDRIFPQVRAQEPSARLCVVGRNPPPGLVERLQTTPGVELHADVPDVRPFLGNCGVMTVPLRIGGGSRLKILEALACCLPVISSTVGAEGLSLEAGRDFARADEPEAMASTLVDAIRSPAPFRAMAENGRRVVLERYDWDALAIKLERVWEKSISALGGRPSPAVLDGPGRPSHVAALPH